MQHYRHGTALQGRGIGGGFHWGSGEDFEAPAIITSLSDFIRGITH